MSKVRVLVVDDEPSARSGLEKLLTAEGYIVETAADGVEALALAKDHAPDVVVTDLKMPNMDGIELAKKLHELESSLPVIVATAFGDVGSAVHAMRAGAEDYLTKPIDFDALIVALERALERRDLRVETENLRLQLRERDGEGLRGLIGASAAMQKVYRVARQVAASRATVLITGESGTGKGELARAIHALGPRANQPFVALHCTSLADSLLESELFGHEKGSFTGASATRRGVFEQADGGTLFIDEIGDLDIALQPKLLRAIQRGETQRVGGTGWMKSNVRILAATRRDLDREVQEGRFRDDLFFRLAVARIELPPLRERGGDVELLARAFWASLGPSAGPFPPEFLARYRGHTWPGNVRELLNTVVRWQALGEMGLGARITEDAPESLAAPPAGAAASVAVPTNDDLVEGLIRAAVPFSKARQLAASDFERRYVTRILDSFSGNVTKAAQASGIGRRYFHMLLAKIDETEKP